jgi:hypothetical protein
MDSDEDIVEFAKKILSDWKQEQENHELEVTFRSNRSDTHFWH